MIKLDEGHFGSPRFSNKSSHCDHIPNIQTNTSDEPSDNRCERSKTKAEKNSFRSSAHADMCCFHNKIIHLYLYIDQEIDWLAFYEHFYAF